MSHLTLKYQKGSSLIELILYISLVSIFISGAVLFAWDIMYGRQKVYAQQVVEQNGRSVLAQISQEIRTAQDISSVSQNQILLSNGTQIDCDANGLIIRPQGSGPYTLTSNQVLISECIFSEIANADSNTKHIDVKLTLQQANAGSANFSAQTTMHQSVELNTAFNEARNVLLDVSQASFSPNQRWLENITLENTGSSDITISQINIAWTGTSGGENITDVNIDATNVWSGSSGSGSALDITDVTLSSSDGVVSIDSFDFDSQMGDAEFITEIVMSDGSIRKAEFTASSGTTPPTPTPTPTSTPTPTPTSTPPVISTCSEYCQSLSYTTGICRKNAGACNQNGETYESGGNAYCTGGKNADTCCCL